jgi:hypothetical protein
MVLYVCNLCGYETLYKTNYTGHLERKKSCIPTSNKQRKKKKVVFECVHCLKLYSRSDSLLRHIQMYCKQKDL